MEEDLSEERPPPLPVVADGRFRHVDPGLIGVGRIHLTIMSGVLLLIASFGLLVAWFHPDVERGLKMVCLGAWWALFPLLGAWTWIWPKVAYRHAFFCLKPDGIVIRTGVFWKTETVVPRSRIQHTDVAQGPLQRAYGIADLVIHTAGTREAVVVLSGLDERLAPRLRDRLLERSGDESSV